MILTCGELHNLCELSLSCVNSITNMELFISSATDSELKAMIQEHLPAHIQDYNMKVKFIKEAAGPGEKLKVPELKTMLQDYTKAPVAPVPVTPRTTVDKLNDREIATAYLLTLKRAGREYAWSAMEAANPELRQFLKDAFTMSCNHAYEIWQWMVKKGFYALSPASQQEIDSAGSFYNLVQ